MPACSTVVETALRRGFGLLVLQAGLLAGGAVAAPPAPVADPAWTVEADPVDPRHYAGITVANGALGLVSAPHPLRVDKLVVAGLYDQREADSHSTIVEGLNPANLYLEVEGQPVGDADTRHFRQSLEMKTGTLASAFDVGASLHVTQSLMALRQLPQSVLSTVELTARKDLRVTVTSAIEAPASLGSEQTRYTRMEHAHVLLPMLTASARTRDGGHRLAASNTFLFPDARGAEPAVVHDDTEAGRNRMRFTATLKAGQRYRFSVVSSVVSSREYANPVNEAERLTIYAMLQGEERLVREHRARWAELWRGDVVIAGDPVAQQSMRLALYHLYAFVREGSGFSLSPMGLSGTGYNGHVFWDTEMWMYPPLLVLHPEIARSLLEYRFARLDAARRNAFAHGYRGAMFPWESADDGSEDTPLWALTGPFQHHITGDVGWAFWKYYQVTGDKAWLRERGYPVLKEVADFWSSRVERNGPGRYDIRNVIGANEWQENIDNNAFTNGMAITVLGYATQAARELGLAPDPDWVQVAANIPILKFPDGTTRENASYRGEEIKQADVNLLAFPLEVVTDPAQIRKDLAFYERRMSPQGPAMGNSVLALLYAKLGEAAKAYAWFNQAYRPNRMPPFGVLSETPESANPYFATGAGGLLQTVMFGFGGLRIDDRGIVEGTPLLPAPWTSLRIERPGNERVRGP